MEIKNKVKILRKDLFIGIEEEGPKKFIQLALNNLTNEFALWHSIDDVFNYNERVYVGLFNNAIIRSSGERFTTLQEYRVYNNKTGYSAGRADLLIYDRQEPNTLYLFEAKKMNTYDAADLADWIEKYSVTELSKVLKQAFYYYEAEKEFYDVTTYMCAIYFENIKNMHHLKFINNQYYNKLSGIFYAVYSYDQDPDHGMAVYGLIRKTVEGD